MDGEDAINKIFTNRYVETSLEKKNTNTSNEKHKHI